MSLLLALVLAAPPANDAGPIFDCAMGGRRLTVTQQGDSLVYRYGTRRAAELRLVADASSGKLFYHRTLYSRGEDQTLRFVNGDYSYVVYAQWTAPSLGLTEEGSSPETYYGGLVVLRGDDIIATRRCTDDKGDMREWPIFKTLPVDEQNLVPAE